MRLTIKLTADLPLIRGEPESTRRQGCPAKTERSFQLGSKNHGLGSHRRSIHGKRRVARRRVKTEQSLNPADRHIHELLPTGHISPCSRAHRSSVQPAPSYRIISRFSESGTRNAIPIAQLAGLSSSEHGRRYQLLALTYTDNTKASR